MSSTSIADVGPTRQCRHACVKWLVNGTLLRTYVCGVAIVRLDSPLDGPIRLHNGSISLQRSRRCRPS